MVDPRLQLRHRDGCLGRRLAGSDGLFLIGIGDQIVEVTACVELVSLVEHELAYRTILIEPRRIPRVDPLTRCSGLTPQLRGKAAAVTCRGRHGGELADGGQEVDGCHEIVADPARRNLPGPVHDAGHMHAAMRRLPLAAFELPAIEATDDPTAGAVVAEEEDERVLAKATLLETRDEPADETVHEADHLGEVPAIIVDPLSRGTRIPVGTVGRGLEGGMSEHHRVVQQKWLRASSRGMGVTGDEVERVVLHERRAVLAVAKILLHPVDLEAWVGVTRWSAGVLPETALVKAEVPGKVRLLTQLPLPADGSGVAPFLEDVRECPLRRREQAEADVVPDVGPARHQLHPRRCAERLDVAVREPHTAGCQPVKMRRPI